MDVSEKVSDYVSSLENKLQEVCLAIRELVLEPQFDLEECWSWSRPIYKSKGQYLCYFVANKNDVNFGFEVGAHLADPESKLLGTGANMRHLKFRDASDYDVDYARTLLTEAISYSAAKSTSGTQ